MGARHFVLFAGAALFAAPALSQSTKPATRLFSDDQPIRITIRGPISAVTRTPANSRAPRAAVLTLTSPSAEQQNIQLSVRGLTRRKRETCDFPPLRVEFAPKLPATSYFDKQRRLKLVTHCRSSTGHQQYVLLEYAAYRMLGVVIPASLRARLAEVDYQAEDGKPMISRLGFFLEDPSDAARRSGLSEAKIVGAIHAARLDPAAAARAAMFEYMIGNLDWSMRAGPAGTTCCHNFKLMAANKAGTGPLTPVPYDFDYSGLVDAPYSVPPEGIRVSSVRDRQYRGYCIHNAHALGAAAEFRAKQQAIVGQLAQVPGLDESRRRKASAYLDSFFRDIATDDEVRKRLLKTCIN